MAASLLAVVFVQDAAQAVSITNRDERDHKVTILPEGESPRDQVLKPNGVLSDVCLKGCVIRLNDNGADEYELEGSEVVSIEDGYLYYDGPEVPADPAPDAPKAEDRKP
jgi:hypothetical protein